MKKYLLNLGLAMFLFGSTPLIAMNSSKTSYFKRGLAVCATLGTGGLTCAHYGLAFGPTWSDAFERKVAEHEFWANVDIINQPSAEAQKFIRDNLAKQGMETPEIVTIRRYSHHTDKEYEKDDLMLKSPMTYNNRIG